jgi:RHS repeat-associated protein
VFSTPASVSPSDNEVKYLHVDVNGSVTASTDINGNSSGSVVYSPYGTTTDAPISHFGFAREWTDKDTGHSYLRARWLDTSTGTFLFEDPLAQITGQSFGYTAGNPLQQVDPLELSSLNPIDWMKSEILNPVGKTVASGWNKFTDGVTSVGNWINENPGHVSSILTVISLVTGSIPVVGTAISVVAGLGAVYYGGKATLQAAKPCLASDTANYNWGDVALNGVGTLAGAASPVVRVLPLLGKTLGTTIDLDNVGFLTVFSSYSVAGINYLTTEINKRRKHECS